MNSLTILFSIVLLCPAVILADSKSVIGVEVYYETLCGDSVRFIQQQLVPSYPALKDHLDVTFVPYGKAQHERDSSGSWVFTCQHGNLECLGNKEQACVLEAIKKHEEPGNQQVNSVNFVGCVMGKNYNNEIVESCARSANLKAETITEYLTCRNDENIANELLVAHGERTKNLDPALTFVPTITINKIHLKNDQNRIRNYFASYICDLLPATEAKPAICAA